jgi:hypothetical protein
MVDYLASPVLRMETGPEQVDAQATHGRVDDGHVGGGDGAGGRRSYVRWGANLQLATGFEGDAAPPGQVPQGPGDLGHGVVGDGEGRIAGTDQDPLELHADQTAEGGREAPRADEGLNIGCP